MKRRQANTGGNETFSVYISESLLNRLVQQAKAKDTRTNEGDKQGEQKKSHDHQNRTKMSSEPSGSNSIMAQPPPPPPTFDPNYIMRQAAFEPSFMLYGMRGEYERKFQQYQQLWRQRWEELDRINRDLHKQSSQKLAEEVDRVQRRYFPDHSLFDGKPCTKTEEALFQCYRDNRERPLLCRAEVRRFAECIEDSRVKMLRHK